jgi:hypothetical protein
VIRQWCAGFGSSQAPRLPAHEERRDLLSIHHIIHLQFFLHAKRSEKEGPGNGKPSAQPRRLPFPAACDPCRMIHHGRREPSWTRIAPGTVLISRINTHLTVFFSHNKPANSTFSTINQRNEQVLDRKNSVFTRLRTRVARSTPDIQRVRTSVSEDSGPGTRELHSCCLSAIASRYKRP